MSLTVFPTVTFATGGSDTAASGAGPTTALTGTAGNVTNASTTATITDAVDLTGVATDGSACLWVNTASGRQWSRISTITGSSGNWTLTLEDSVWTTSTNVSWGIGGKRLSIDNTNSRKLFTADVKAGWTVQINNDQTISGGAIGLAVVGDTTSGAVLITGNSDSPRPVLTITTNANHFGVPSGGYIQFAKLKLACSSATRTSANGIQTSSGPSSTVLIINCVLGDATNKLNSGIYLPNGVSQWSVLDTEITSCVSSGISVAPGAASGLLCDNCRIHDNTGAGIYNSTTGFSTLTVQNCVINANGSHGLDLSNIASTTITVTNNTIDGNTGSGINLGAMKHVNVVIYDNNLTGNSAYGVAWTVSAADRIKDFIDYNCFGSGSASDGPANTSGAYNGVTAGAHDQVGVSPNYTNRGATPPNFLPTSTSNVKAKGYPDTTRTIGGNTGGTTTYETIGVAQLQVTGGMLVHPGTAGGARG